MNPFNHRGKRLGLTEGPRSGRDGTSYNNRPSESRSDWGDGNQSVRIPSNLSFTASHSRRDLEVRGDRDESTAIGNQHSERTSTRNCRNKNKITGSKGSEKFQRNMIVDTRRSQLLIIDEVPSTEGMGEKTIIKTRFRSRSKRPERHPSAKI